MADIIKYSGDRRWLIAEQEGRYYFFDTAGEKARPVETPSGRLVETSYISLADRILLDLEIFGAENMTAESIIPWHFTMIDNFIKMEHEQVEQMLNECFMKKHDWTFDIDEEVFGDSEERVEAIRTWLSKCTHMQMTAACCIGNAYHSINIAYVLAALLENYSGKALRKQFKALAAIVEDNDFYDDIDSIMGVFDTFKLYYGIHNDENGAIINQALSLVNDSEGSMDFVISEEALVGRNFYHYTDGELDEQQPLVLATDLSDIEEADEECDEEDDDYDDDFEDDEDDDYDEDLDEYLPSDCWVKKISAFEDDDEVYYIIAITVEDGKAKDIVVIRDEVSRAGGGMFFIPGMAMPANHYYEEVDFDDYPEVVDREFDALKAGKYLPNNFSFIGKKLPQEILDRGGNGGDMTDHTYAIQSAYRLAYMHMSVTTTEEGIIEDFDYSTYQSSGSAYGDMFSRPQHLNDRHEEIIDMLLYIIDLYTEEEYKQLV